MGLCHYHIYSVVKRILQVITAFTIKQIIFLFLLMIYIYITQTTTIYIYIFRVCKNHLRNK